jgi:hypothetical protein
VWWWVGVWVVYGGSMANVFFYSFSIVLLFFFVVALYGVMKGHVGGTIGVAVRCC